MTLYSEEDFFDTLGALLLFSEDFGILLNHLALGVSYYKILSMLKYYKGKIYNINFKEKISQNVKFYTEKLFVTVSNIQEDLLAMGEEDDFFNYNFICRSSKIVGKICDELLGEHGYGDVAALSEQSAGVDLSDFFIPLDNEEDEFDETDN